MTAPLSDDVRLVERLQSEVDQFNGVWGKDNASHYTIPVPELSRLLALASRAVLAPEPEAPTPTFEGAAKFLERDEHVPRFTAQVRLWRHMGDERIGLQVSEECVLILRGRASYISKEVAAALPSQGPEAPTMCPTCKHKPHPAGGCFNMASDGGCECRTATPGTRKEVRAARIRAVGEIIARGLDGAWGDYTSDTGCFPECFRIEKGRGGKGPYLYAEFAKMGGMFIESAADASFAELEAFFSRPAPSLEPTRGGKPVLPSSAIVTPSVHLHGTSFAAQMDGVIRGGAYYIVRADAVEIAPSSPASEGV